MGVDSRIEGEAAEIAAVQVYQIDFLISVAVEVCADPSCGGTKHDIAPIASTTRPIERMRPSETSQIPSQKTCPISGTRAMRFRLTATVFRYGCGYPLDCGYE